MESSLDALREAEAFFFRWKPELTPLARAFLLGVLERWPDTEIVTQRSQVGLRDPRPYCALWPPNHVGIRRGSEPCLILSLFLPYRLDSPRIVQAVEPYPGRWTNHLLLHAEEDLDDQLWTWAADARRFRCKR